jgi:hypothetical protein
VHRSLAAGLLLSVWVTFFAHESCGAVEAWQHKVTAEPSRASSVSGAPAAPKDPVDQADSRQNNRETESDTEGSKPIRVYILLGGLAGPDGIVTSAGMFQLAKMLLTLPNTQVTTYTWDKWRQAYKAIRTNEGRAKIVIIGYSGGGSRATWLANMPSKPQIDLLISYDPSPQWQMKPVGDNVKKALIFHNINTMWLPGLGHLGGGQLVGEARHNPGITVHAPSIETINIAEQHMLVQIDRTLHRRSLEAVRSLASAAPVRSMRGRTIAKQSLHRTVSLTAEWQLAPEHGY